MLVPAMILLSACPVFSSLLSAFSPGLQSLGYSQLPLETSASPLLSQAAKLVKAAPLVSTPFAPSLPHTLNAWCFWGRHLSACIPFNLPFCFLPQFSEQQVITAQVKNLGAEGAIPPVPTAGRACVPAEPSTWGLSKR